MTIFQWIGIGVSALVLLAAVAFVLLAAYAAWLEFGPDFYCREPESTVLWSTYRTDVRTGEGKRVKASEDRRVTFLFGTSWRFRWFFGLLIFKREDES